MSEEESKVVVFTMRVSDSEPVPREFGDTHIMTCDRCGESVYTTSTTYTSLHEQGLHDYEIICNICAIPLIEKELEKAEEDRSAQVAADPDMQPIIEGHEEEFLRWLLARSKGQAGPIR